MYNNLSTIKNKPSNKKDITLLTNLIDNYNLNHYQLYQENFYKSTTLTEFIQQSILRQVQTDDAFDDKGAFTVLEVKPSSFGFKEEVEKYTFKNKNGVLTAVRPFATTLEEVVENQYISDKPSQILFNFTTHKGMENKYYHKVFGFGIDIDNAGVNGLSILHKNMAVDRSGIYPSYMGLSSSGLHLYFYFNPAKYSKKYNDILNRVVSALYEYYFDLGVIGTKSLTKLPAIQQFKLPTSYTKDGSTRIPLYKIHPGYWNVYYLVKSLPKKYKDMIGLTPEEIEILESDGESVETVQKKNYKGLDKGRIADTNLVRWYSVANEIYPTLFNSITEYKGSLEGKRGRLLVLFSHILSQAFMVNPGLNKIKEFDRILKTILSKDDETNAPLTKEEIRKIKQVLITPTDEVIYYGWKEFINREYFSDVFSKELLSKINSMLRGSNLTQSERKIFRLATNAHYSKDRESKIRMAIYSVRSELGQVIWKGLTETQTTTLINKKIKSIYGLDKAYTRKEIITELESIRKAEPKRFKQFWNNDNQRISKAFNKLTEWIDKGNLSNNELFNNLGLGKDEKSKLIKQAIIEIKDLVNYDLSNVSWIDFDYNLPRDIDFSLTEVAKIQWTLEHRLIPMFINGEIELDTYKELLHSLVARLLKKGSRNLNDFFNEITVCRKMEIFRNSTIRVATLIYKIMNKSKFSKNLLNIKNMKNLKLITKKIKISIKDTYIKLANKIEFRHSNLSLDFYKLKRKLIDLYSNIGGFDLTKVISRIIDELGNDYKVRSLINSSKISY